MQKIKLDGKTRILIKDKNGKRHVLDMIFDNVQLEFDQDSKSISLSNAKKEDTKKAG